VVAFKKALLAKASKIPANWDSMEIRQWVMDCAKDAWVAHYQIKILSLVLDVPRPSLAVLRTYSGRCQHPLTLSADRIGEKPFHCPEGSEEFV
jgi:hypothetical protein